MSDEEPCLFKVGEAMLAGEIEYRKGNFDAAFGHLREAVRFEQKSGTSRGPRLNRTLLPCGTIGDIYLCRSEICFRSVGVSMYIP